MSRLAAVVFWSVIAAAFIGPGTCGSLAPMSNTSRPPTLRSCTRIPTGTPSALASSSGTLRVRTSAAS